MQFVPFPALAQNKPLCQPLLYLKLKAAETLLIRMESLTKIRSIFSPSYPHIKQHLSLIYLYPSLSFSRCFFQIRKLFFQIRPHTHMPEKFPKKQNFMDIVFMNQRMNQPFYRINFFACPDMFQLQFICRHIFRMMNYISIVKSPVLMQKSLPVSFVNGR